MSKVVLNQLPNIQFVSATKKKKKRSQLLKVVCDNDFAKAICECCWNIVHQRVKINPINRRRLSKHKTLLRRISNYTLPLKKRKAIIQSGGFASVLPFLIGPIVSGITALLRK